MSTFVLLAIAAALVLLVIEGAFVARLSPEKIKKIITRSVLVASALFILGMVLIGNLHWLFTPLAVALPFIDHLYSALRLAMKTWGVAQSSQQVARAVGRFAQQSRDALNDATRTKPQTRNQTIPPRSSSMTQNEALKILGLAPGATPQKIKEAHRRLMRSVHPDRGGSSQQAAQVNRAKDTLLNN